MKRKILRVLGFTLLIIMGFLIALPFFLENKIADIIKNKVNQNINATLNFNDAQLSLFKSFPDVYLDLKGVTLINNAPFAGDTLFSAADIGLELSLKEVFKSADEPIGIKKLFLDGARLNIKVNDTGLANYDIVLEGEKPQKITPPDEESSFSFNLQEYALTNAEVIYHDFNSGIHLNISEMNHSGTGNLSLNTSELKTNTKALVSFKIDSTQYLSNNSLALDALIGIDLQQNTYTFLENSALINQLPLVFDGFIQVNEDHQNIDVSFKTPSSEFKNFLALFPEGYSTNLDGVTTTGNFEIMGQFKGIVDDDHIPMFMIRMHSEDASFKYSDLPKSVDHVFIEMEILNETGITEDTHIAIDQMQFQIDEDRFNLNAKINELLGNTKVTLNANGKINLAHIAEAYPMPNNYPLTGVLTAAIKTDFDMASLENHDYQNTKTTGEASVSGFYYETEELKNPVDITMAKLTFSPSLVSLDAFEGTMGQTDFSARGTLTNALGYVFNNEDLEGRFELKSNVFAVDDFVVEEGEVLKTEEKSQGTTERIRVPSFLNAIIDVSANTVLYDNLIVKNVKGQLLVNDQTAKLQNVTSEVFDGQLSLNGLVNTKGEISTFDMELSVEGFKIAESFHALELFKVLAPIAQAFQGKLNSDIKISGDLKDDMTPNLGTLSGDLLGQLLSARVSTQNTPALAALDNQFDFIDLDALNWDDLKTSLSFNDGKVVTNPITLTYKDIGITLSGSHTFDAQLQYQAVLDVPVNYLGDEVNALIAKIDDESLQGLTIPVLATISGDYANPKVTTDLTSGVSKLTQQLVAIQKQKLINQGKDKAIDVLGELLGKNTDSTQTDTTSNNGVVTVLEGVLGNTKKDSAQVDSSAQNNDVRKTAKSILGLLGKKKKDSVEKN